MSFETSKDDGLGLIEIVLRTTQRPLPIRKAAEGDIAGKRISYDERRMKYKAVSFESIIPEEHRFYSTIHKIQWAP